MLASDAIGRAGNQSGVLMDSWPRTFRTAGDALSFADAFLTDPHVQSQMNAIKRDRVQQSRGNGPTLHGLQELAETITVAVSGLPRPAGPLFRFVYGRQTDYLWIADNLAHQAWKGPGDGLIPRRKTITECRNLALLLMEKRRRWERHRQRMPMAQVAEHLNMSRGHFSDAWLLESSTIESDITQLLRQAERALEANPAMRHILD